jgi:hypothetical protein
LTPEFVVSIPEQLEDGILYVSMPFATAGHNCCCGCGNQVFTPFTPSDWQLKFDGKVSITPSIGNWSFKCQSHYWIVRDNVKWAGKMSREEIQKGREADRLRKRRQFGKLPTPAEPVVVEPVKKKRRFWHRLFGN